MTHFLLAKAYILSGTWSFSSVGLPFQPVAPFPVYQCSEEQRVTVVPK